MTRFSGVVIAILALIIQPLMAGALTIAPNSWTASTVNSTPVLADLHPVRSTTVSKYDDDLYIDQDQDGHAHYALTINKKNDSTPWHKDLSGLQEEKTSCDSNCEIPGYCSTTCVPGYIYFQEKPLPSLGQQRVMIIIAAKNHFISATRSRVYYPPRLS